MFFCILLGQTNETFNKRRSHCVCPNCVSGLNSGSGNVQQKSHSCHYPGCGKVGFSIKKYSYWKKGHRSFNHLNLLSEPTENKKMGLLMSTYTHCMIYNGILVSSLDSRSSSLCSSPVWGHWHFTCGVLGQIPSHAYPLNLMSPFSGHSS